jgi:hypothetical protein
MPRLLEVVVRERAGNPARFAGDCSRMKVYACPNGRDVEHTAIDQPVCVE